MRRRDFITLLGGTAAWPLTARAQPADRMRRVGLMMPLSADDPQGQARMGAFLQGLQQAGWIIGRNVQVDIRWNANDPDSSRKSGAELLASAPAVLVATGSQGLAALLQMTRTVPIVFVLVADPVGAGFVKNLAQPGGNATGFTPFEYGVTAKWLELLKEITPGMKRAAVLRDSAAQGVGEFGAIQAVAPSVGVEIVPVNIGTAEEIERAVENFARFPDRGLIVTNNVLSMLHRHLIISLAAAHKLPAVYYERVFVAAGGLISYGPALIDQYRRAAEYVDRILKGEKPDDLPVQAPTKYELAINLKTAKALGLIVPPQLLARADEVIE